MADVGELFVRIRPAPGSASAFEAEATPGIASAGKGLAKTFLAAFAIGGVAKTIETVVKAATGQQSAFAVLNKTVENAGAANELYGQSLDEIVEKQSTLKGFSTGDISSALTVLVSATKNTAEALKDLGLAEDISRAKGTDLATAALGVAKAEQGSATALQRSGIVVPKVTAAVDALKTAHENAIIAGAKFTDQQKAEYAAALLTAAAQDKSATRLKDLATIQQRFGGDAATFAQTASGQFDRLDASLHEVEVGIGNNIIPALLSGTQDAIEFAKALASPEVLAAVGTYAAIKTGLEVVSLAQAAYQKILAAGGATVAADTTAESAYTAAIIANTEALTANAVAAEASGTANALRLGGISTGGFAAPVAEDVEAAAVPEEVAGGGLLAGLTALATGPTAIIAGVAAIAGGIAYLATRESSATAATRGLEDSLKDLVAAQEALPLERSAVNQDRITVAQDRTALSASKLAHSSLDYQQLLQNLDQALITQTNDQKTLKTTVDAASSAYDAERQHIDDLTSAIQKQHEFIGGSRGAAVGPNVNPLRQQAQDASQFAAEVQKAVDNSKGLTTVQTHNLLLLEQYADVLGKIPDKKTTDLILDNKNAELSIEQLLADLGPGFADQANYALGEAVQNAINKLADLSGDAEDQGKTIGNAFVAGVENALKSLDPIVTAVKAQIAANAQLAQTVDPLKQQVADDQASLADLQQQASDAATQGAQDLANAVQSAKQSLDTIGQSIADSLTTFIDKPLDDAATRISDAQAKLSALNDQVSLQRLGEEVVLPGNRRLSSNPATAISQLEALQKAHPNDSALAQYILQFRSLALQVEGDSNQIKQNSANLVTTAAKTQLANLTDRFNTGQISEATLERDVTALLERNGLTPKTAKTRGASFADTLAAQLTGLGQQAGALSGFGNSSGLIPSITRPLDTLNATQKTLAGIASSERAKQLSESKTQTKILGDISAAQKANSFTTSLTHNPGVGNARTKRLAGTLP